MLNPGVLFTAITIVLPVSEINCDPAPTQDIDFQSILELAQQQGANKNREVKEVRYETDSSEDSRSNYEPLKSQEIVQLIHKATQQMNLLDNRNDDNDSGERKKQSGNKHRNKDKTYKGLHYYDLYKDLNENKLNDDIFYGHQPSVKSRYKYKDDDVRYKHSRYNQEALEQLLSQNVLDKKYQGKNRYRLVPNSLVGSSELKNDRTEDRNNQEALEQLLSQNVLDKKYQSKPRYKFVQNNLVRSSELKNDRTEDRNLGAYSKVYVILNPKAIEKSANKDKLNDLLEKILSLTSSSHGLEQEKSNRANRYKGFSVLPGFLSRRARRENREMYNAKDSIEEDFKPKRPRVERGGGGGGGGGGRTAIPYIRHRGDIYERDH